MLERILCLIIGYAFGLIQSGFIAGKIHGIDIRQHGSGNSGATNTLRVLGVKSGLIVLLCDACKCVVAVIVTYYLFGIKQPELIILFKMYTAAGVILGHNFPVWLNFKGGKGIAATSGLIISFGPLWVLTNLLIFALAFLTTHFVSLGSLLIYGGFLIEVILCGQLGVFGKASAIGFFNTTSTVVVPQSVLCEIYFITLLLTIMAYVRHRKNIVRLLHHEESKVYLTKKIGNKHSEETKNQKPII